MTIGTKGKNTVQCTYQNEDSSANFLSLGVGHHTEVDVEAAPFVKPF